ncbi:hypothetical protein OG216_09940 [Streptomycetaceae bacterium NBC_01309]
MNQPVEYAQQQTVALPSRVSQGTAVEQSRAVAEVQAAVFVAQQNPRNIDLAKAQMRMSCTHYGLAERAFYTFSRGGDPITGPSIHLARELARCWGNLQYGISELRRDDVYGESEMQAWAWDLETNTRSAQTFIVPHKRDTKKGVRELKDMRDIYENNANNGARRVREAIFSILPPWFVEEAKSLLWQTLDRGPGKPLPERIAEAVESFGRGGVTLVQLETRLGRPREEWNERDVARLGVIYKSIDRGETTAAEEFAPPRVTADEVRQQAAQASSEEPPSDDSYDGSQTDSDEPLPEATSEPWPTPAPIPGAEQ